MKVIISPSKIKGCLTAPASKSSMQRACAAALLHTGTTILFNAGTSNDDKVALNIIQSLGAKVTTSEDKIIIESEGFSANTIVVEKEITCGESGLSFRMFAPIAALSASAITLTGTGSLLKRPMNFFDEVFPKLTVNIKSNKGFLPLHFQGPLLPKEITIDGSLSSQYLTGLLFAFGAATNKGVSILVKNLNSRPYIDLTLNVIKKFGYNVENNNYKEFYINPKTSLKVSIEYTVEADWSSVSFLLVAGAIAGSVKLKGLNENSTQADKEIISVLKECGAIINYDDDAIAVSTSTLKAFTFNATHCPDLFPPLAALAAYCNGTSKISGIHRLLAKESNRAVTIQETFGKMGIEILLDEDDMYITGGTINQATVSSHYDHRIAMAAAVAALGAVGPIEIEHADAANKSYPTFYKDLQKIGVELTIFEA